MPVRIHVALCVAFGLCGSLTPTAYPQDEGFPPAAEDLLLTPDEAAASEALSAFAWGLFLQMEAKVKPDRFIEHYRSALERLPDSDVILQHLVMPWLLERNFAKIVEAVGPIAADNPSVARLQLITTQALLAQDRTDDAISLLRQALEHGGWSDARLVRELFVCYWREKRHNDVRRLLRQARGKLGREGTFFVEHAAAVFCDALAHVPEDQPSGRRKRRLEGRALAHARKAFGAITQADRPEDLETLANLFLTYEAWDELARLGRFAREKDGFASPELDILLVGALQRLGEEEECESVLRSVAEAARTRPHLFVRIAHHYLATDDSRQAAAFFERALVSFPNALEVRLRLAYVYLRLDQAERCLALLEKLKKLPAEAYFLLSHAYRRLERNEDAAKALALAEEAALESEDSDFFTVDFYLFFATLCEDLGYTDRSLEKIEKAVALEPTDPVCANFKGYVLADHSRDLDLAEELVLKALEAEPRNFAYLDSLAWVYYRQQRHREALIEINKSLRESTRIPDPVVLDHAGDIYAANELWVLARTYWQAALASEVKDKDAARIRQKLADAPPAQSAESGR